MTERMWPTGPAVSGNRVVFYGNPNRSTDTAPTVGEGDDWGRIFDGHGWVENSEPVDGDDEDSWFSDGSDTAHQEWLDDMGHVNDDGDVR